MLEENGLTYLSGKADTPDALHQAGSDLYWVIPVAYRLKSENAKVVLKSPLIGVSTDGGKNWKFLDTSGGETNVRKLVPEIPGALKFPPDEDPTVEPG